MFVNDLIKKLYNRFSFIQPILPIPETNLMTLCYSEKLGIWCRDYYICLCWHFHCLCLVLTRQYSVPCLRSMYRLRFIKIYVMTLMKDREVPTFTKKWSRNLLLIPQQREGRGIGGISPVRLIFRAKNKKIYLSVP